VTVPKDPHSRPPDPAGTRPKVRPDDLRPSGEYRALPVGPAAPGQPTPGEAAPGQTTPPPAGAPPATEAGRLKDAPGLLPDRPAQPQPPALAGTATPAPHAPRFQFMLGALGALAVTAIVLAVTLATGPKSRPAPAWSDWAPTGDVDPAEQIAEHVAPQYLLSPGKELVSITGGPQAIGGQPVVVALRSSGSAPAQLPENGVFYQLCGGGSNCSIPGKPSTARGLLVQREALELALYTFHFLKGADQVIVTYPPLPPTKGSKASVSSAASETTGVSGSPPTRGRALLFRREDLSPALAQPLSATLSSVTPTIATVERAPESQRVYELTGKLLYNFDIIQQSSGLVLLLQSPSIG
jgi:hypothetical protein